MRAEEWSGPCPSYPCGSSSTTPEDCPHLVWLAEMNSSITTWAPFTKSPNCASHATRASGRATE